MSTIQPKEPLPPPDETAMPEMSLAEHLEELRWRLIYALAGLTVGMLISLVFGKWIIALLKSPYYRVVENLGMEPNLSVIGPTAAVLIYIKVALLGGLVIASPWIAWHGWQFLAAGLYPSEKRYVVVAVPISTALFVGGACFFLFGVSVPTLSFFLAFSGFLEVIPIITLDSHITLMVRGMIASGIAFQTPVVIFLMIAMGITTTQSLARYRKHVVVAFFALAAIFTSPSPIDQVALALPMWALYELGMLAGWLLIERGRSAEEG